MMPREATATDAPETIALWHDCGLTRPWNDPQADFDRASAQTASTILVIDGTAGIVASVMVGDDGHRGWVYYLAVARDRRGVGLGRGLMRAAENWLAARGAAKIQLMVREDNRAALGFYAALGYAVQPVVTIGRALDR